MCKIFAKMFRVIFTLASLIDSYNLLWTVWLFINTSRHQIQLYQFGTDVVGCC